MKRVLLVFVTFFCIVFGERYPRSFNGSVGMIHRDYADGTVAKIALNFTKEKDINLKKFYENFEKVSIVDDRLKFNGTQNSFKNYPKVKQLSLRRTMSSNNNLKTTNHQDHSKGNRTQDQKENSIKGVNKKSTDSKVQQEKLMDGMSKNKNEQVGEKIHKHLKRTIDTDMILKLATERFMNMGAQTDSQRKMTFLNEKPKYKRKVERSLNARTEHSEWLILPNHNVDSIDHFKNDSMTDEYGNKLIISSYRQPGAIMNNNKILSHSQSNLPKFDNDKRRKNVLNTGRRNPDTFGYRIIGMRKRKNFKNSSSRRPNIRNMQNENTDTEYEINFQKRNFETINANDSQVVDPTFQSFTDYPNLSDSQYPNFEEQGTVNYENLKFGKQGLTDFTESEIPTELTVLPNNSVSEQFETLWDFENGVNAKSILENRTKFQTFSFEPGQPNQYPNLNSNVQSSPKNERRRIPVDAPYYFDREHFQNLPANEIFNQNRVIVQNSTVPTKLYPKEDLEKVYKGVRFFPHHRIKRQDYYPLPLKESKKDSAISSKKYSKNHSIRTRDIDEHFLNLKDNVHDYFFEKDLFTKAEEQDYRDSTFHEDHTNSLNLKDIPKTMNMVIFKRKIDENESAKENPSSSNSTVSEMLEKNLESINSKNKFKNNKEITHKDETDQKKVSKIALKMKVSKINHHKANKNDPPKFKPDDTKEIGSKIEVNIPKEDHQAPDLKTDKIKKEYITMANSLMKDALNEDHVNKKIVLPVKIKENDLMIDFITSTDIYPEAPDKQPWKQNNQKGINKISEADTRKSEDDDGKKKWPISPGPITCNSDYEVSTTFAAKPTEYPFMVSVQYKNLVTEELSHICNGVIVDTQFIVSAAHCLNNRDNFELLVQRTHDLCDDDVKSVPVVLVIEHENYNRSTRMNDLALLRLKYEIDADRVSFPETDIINNDFYSVGWGELMWNRFEKNVTKIQQKLPVSRYSKKMKEDPGTIYVNTAGFDITGAFRGDYGGILMNENKEFIGVQSKLYPYENYEVFMRIRTYLPWIENMMKMSKRLSINE